MRVSSKKETNDTLAFEGLSPHEGKPRQSFIDDQKQQDAQVRNLAFPQLDSSNSIHSCTLYLSDHFPTEHHHVIYPQLDVHSVQHIVEQMISMRIKLAQVDPKELPRSPPPPPSPPTFFLVVFVLVLGASSKLRAPLQDTNITNKAYIFIYAATFCPRI